METALETIEDPEPMCPICYGDLETDPMKLAEESRAFSTEVNSVVEQPLTKKGQEKVKNMRLTKCMKTPCNHYYHPTCLTEWMTLKMECTSCREKLPAD